MIELNLTSLFQLVSFLLLMWALKKLLYDKFFEIIKERKEKISQELTEAEKLRKDAEEYKSKYAVEMAEARKKADEIIKKAETRAEEIVTSSKGAAQQEASRIINNAQLEATREKEKAMLEVKGAVVTTAIEMVGRFLGREMDEAARKEYTKKMLKNMGDKQ